MNQNIMCLREATESDHSFVYNSWLKSFRQGSPWARLVPPQIFYANHKQVIALILKAAKVLIACNPEDPEQIYGYVVYTPHRGTVIHYVYVKQPYRQLGFAKKLIAEAKQEQHINILPLTATHITVIWEQHLRDRFNMIYNPYILEAVR
mgnify:CR=1 FL=1